MEIMAIINPIYTQQRLLGVFLKKRTPTDGRQNFDLSPPLILAKTCFIILHLVVLYFFFRDMQEVKDFAKASTIKFLSGFRVISYFVIMMTVSMASNRHFELTREQFISLAKVDRDLGEMNARDILKRHNRTCKRKVYLLMVLMNIVLSVLLEFLVPFKVPGLYFILCLYPRWVINGVNISFFVILDMLEKRFEIVNTLVEKITDDSKIVIRDLHKIVEIHRSLVRISREINYTFSLQILMCITMNFVLLIGDLHTSLYIIFFNLFGKHYNLVVEMLRNCGCYFFEFCYLARRSSGLCHQANLTKVILLGIEVDVNKEDERNAVISSTFKLMQNKLNITACKMFAIDNALLFSICGAASSYIFIMLQLDMGTANSLKSANFTNRSAL